MLDDYDEGVILDDQDEMLLTRTDGECASGEVGMSLKYGTGAACSTQRSISSVPGEFEKRITDIKTKLNQIKSSINNELVG